MSKEKEHIVGHMRTHLPYAYTCKPFKPVIHLALSTIIRNQEVYHMQRRQESQ